MCTVLIEGGRVTLGPVSVLKFGSSLLGDADGFRVAAEEIGREVALGRRVLAVVSAMKGTTDLLLGTAAALSDAPAGALLASLLGTGEDASVALLGISLTARGLHAHTVPTDALALETTGPLHDAEPVGVDLDRLVAWLSTHEVVVVPGFIGRDDTGSPSLLGRGGSDLTALFLAYVLGVDEIRLVKDVDGVHPTDPAAGSAASEPLDAASWSEVARVGNGVVQDKALRYAERFGIRFRVAAPGGLGTLVGPERPRVRRGGARRPRLGPTGSPVEKLLRLCRLLEELGRHGLDPVQERRIGHDGRDVALVQIEFGAATRRAPHRTPRSRPIPRRSILRRCGARGFDPSPAPRQNQEGVKRHG